jgi:hypothetical protein
MHNHFKESGVNEIDKVCLDMSCQNITHIGDSNQLENICKNVEEIYLSKNEIIEWNEVFRKRFLNELKSNFSIYLCFYQG